MTPPLPLPREGWFVVGPVPGGYALLAPVCNLSPFQGLRADAQRAREFKDFNDDKDIKDAPRYLCSASAR